MSSTSAVILAAGLSQRMGNINKLLIPVNGKPMVRHVIEAYLAANIEHVIVVVGHQHNIVRKALEGLPVEIVFNPGYQDGQLSSIRCGLKALIEYSKSHSEKHTSQSINDNNQCVFIGLSDQPLLSSTDINCLISQFSTRPEKTKSILVPYYQGQRGNPILLTHQQATKVDNDGVHLGCRKLIDKHPEKVFPLEVFHNHYHCDLDTVIDVEQLLGSEAIKEVSLS